MSRNELFNELYEFGKKDAANLFVAVLFFRFLVGPCEYPGTWCNIIGILTAIFEIMFFISLISLIIGFIGKKIYK